MCRYWFLDLLIYNYIYIYFDKNQTSCYNYLQRIYSLKLTFFSQRRFIAWMSVFHLTEKVKNVSKWSIKDGLHLFAVPMVLLVKRPFNQLLFKCNSAFNSFHRISIFPQSENMLISWKDLSCKRLCIH